MIKKRVDADQYPQEGISMLHILICDDEPEFASLLKAKITGLPTYSRRRMSIECGTQRQYSDFCHQLWRVCGGRIRSERFPFSAEAAPGRKAAGLF